MVYEMLFNLAAQESPAREVNELTIDEIVHYMKHQFDPRRFVVPERYKFWSDMQRKPGETIPELVARIREDSATCDFASIRNPSDEALRTRFICSVANEAVLKALFKIKDDELDFARAMEVATESEGSAKVAKETVYGPKPKAVHKVQRTHNSTGKRQVSDTPDARQSQKCYRCGKTNHLASVCRFKNATCHFCKRTVHLEIACL